MPTTRNTSTVRALALAALGVLLSLVGLGATALAGGSTTGCSGPYGWPVEPFDRAHPIRGAFGDPRTIFDGPPTRETLLAASGRFSFHQGADISVPDGTPVHAVSGGTVVRVTQETVGVDCGNGRAFEYWHVNASVRVGQHVAAGETVIGLVQRASGHVHLTQLEQGRAVNPVAPGRLTPYEDTTEPRILAISLRRSDGAADEMPHSVGGRVQLLVEAVDQPALPVPGLWSDLPVTPARVTWRIERWPARTVIAEREARDVRDHLPAKERFWETFARGTHQNMAVFGRHYSYLQGGRYLFRLSPEGLDTRTLRNGVHTLVVRAEDGAGNEDVARLRFTVRN
jgi:Peptidase family M23